ncbi:MAG: glycosyltransferase [Verrucomicrobiota bacterium]|nr:glycosyltransferase [Verrucomicrobiota bacterium]
MPGKRLYYHLKPYLPWGLRMALRRIVARQKRKACKDIWPINEAAGQPPDGWPGWPNGKKFALVLTHDVEGPVGLAKCRQLMLLEKELGFRSSFNFIPEGDYAVSRELREELAQNGFEVGIHDLHHDGRLYWTREAFSENAKWINHYLKEWGAVGFRSAFMLRNLDWLHELNIQYDASTFDSDPFEPQPEGAGTIFPFWVSRDTRGAVPISHLPSPAASRPGYVELPYTLPQDSTLFLVLRETSPEIWLQKLDWIAERGGMALVNVHPDYLRFPDEPASLRTFPVEFYRRFLEYARQRHAPSFWKPLPRELAAWHLREVPHASPKSSEGDAAGVNGERHSVRGSLRGKRAAVLLYSGIVFDARPRRELEALLDQGMAVDVICLHKNSALPKEEVHGPLRVTRIPIRHDRFRKTAYFRNYGWFFLRAFASLTARSFRKRYDLVHIHNMPDALVFAALVPRLLGAKIILDLHDPMPELYQTIHGIKEDSGLVRLLKRLERWSIRFAQLVLTPNEAFRRLFCMRGCPPSKVQVIMNAPDEEIFDPRRPAAKYAGNSSLSKSRAYQELFVTRHGVGAVLGDEETFDPVPPSAEGTGHPPKTEFRLLYHGLIVERHGLGTAIAALTQLSGELPDMVLDIFGERNIYLSRILEDARKMGLNGRIRYHGLCRLDDVPAAIQQADLGVIPNLRTPFTEINFPTRIFEYLSMEKPVIVPDTPGIRDYFDDSQIIFFKPGSAEDLARAIRWVHGHPAESAAYVARGREVYERHLWSLERERFIGAVGGLFAR